MGSAVMIHATHRTLSVEINEKDTYAVLRLDVRERGHLTAETSIFVDYAQLGELLQRLTSSPRVMEATKGTLSDAAVYTALALAKGNPEVRSLLQFHLGCMDDDEREDTGEPVRSVASELRALQVDEREDTGESVLCGIRKVVTGGDLLSCTELLGHQGPHTYVRLANAES